MGSGFRDSFDEYINDNLGDLDDSSIDLRSMAPRRSRRKTKKNRAMGRKTGRRKSSYKSRKQKTLFGLKKGRKKSRRKGMSKEFLRQLRKKHGLGEFKRR